MENIIGSGIPLSCYRRLCNFRYIMTIRGNQELDEYFKSLLDSGNPEHVSFLNEFKQRLSRIDCISI